MPPLKVTVDGSVVVGPADRKLPPAMAPLGMSANGWSEFRMLPPTIDALTEPVRVQGVTRCRSPGREEQEGSRAAAQGAGDLRLRAERSGEGRRCEQRLDEFHSG